MPRSSARVSWRLIITMTLISVVACKTQQETTGDSNIAAAGNKDAAKLFSSNDVLKLKLTANYQDLFSHGLAADTLHNPTYKVPASLSYQDQSGQTVNLQGELSLRGATSLNECSFPKLKLKILSETNGTIFKGARNTKIGTHCGDDDPSANSALGRLRNEISPQREAILYKIIDATGTPIAKTRPAVISYIDAVTKQVTERKAFFIEDVDKTAERYGGTEFDTAIPGSYQSDIFKTIGAEALARLHLAENLVGNWDWDLPAEVTPRRSVHNIKIVSLPNSHEVALPVDFDMASLVTGRPHFSGNKQSTAFFADKPLLFRYIADQMYQTKAALPKATIDHVLSEFAARKPLIIAAIAVADLDEAGRGIMRDHVETFFDVATPANFSLPMIKEAMTPAYADQDMTKKKCMPLRRGTPVKVLQHVKDKVQVEVWGMECGKDYVVWLDEADIGDDIAQ